MSLKKEELNKCGIYWIVNVVNNKKFIGQTKNFRLRWNTHKYCLNKNKHGNPHLQSSWNKYGKDNFKFEILLLCPIENLDMEEIKLIKEHSVTNRMFGYNVTEGGNRPVITEATKRKMSLARIGKKTPHSEATKRKISESHKGVTLSKEHIEALKISHLGQVAWNKGKSWDEKTKEKLSQSHMGQRKGIRVLENYFGEDNPFFGKKHSEETKQKIRDSLKKYRETKSLK